MNTDPVADMLARIRNALLARHESVEMPHSKLKVHIAEILKQEGYISDFSVQQEERAQLRVQLKYGRDRIPAIAGLRRASRPGRRLYVRHTAIPSVLNGMGISIISTSHGVLTDRDARKQNIGGELLCEVW
ncbi:MAG TPA: 30S ribosomal protein S8 [Polyangiales bacterium]|jgi:small subunit ribosomal protein S8